METNETMINIYVTDEDVERNFSIWRNESLDDDSYQENCDDTDMGDLDIDIATIQKGNIKYLVFTSCDKWNVYICKAELFDDKKELWATREMYNITSESEEWETVNDLTNYLLGLNFEETQPLKNIVQFLEKKIKNQEAILSDAYWLDTTTFYVSFAFSSEELKKYFHNCIDDEDGDCHLCAEYHQDEHKFVYELIFDEDKLNMDNEMQSTIIDWYIIEQAKSF